MFCVHCTGAVVDLSNAEREERGMRSLLRHLHRIRDHSNNIGDRDAKEDQEIRGDEEQRGNEWQELGGLLKLQEDPVIR